jgi:hypothetical protein
VKPAQLIPCSLVLSIGLIAGTAFGQAAPPPADTEPAAAAPAPPPVPAASPPADLPPPPPPKTSPPAAPQGKVVISAPPVPGATQRAGYHVHDGFYLRLAAGIGGGHGSVSSDDRGVPSFDAGGPGLALNLWIGGTPWRGVALGGLLSLQGLGESNVEVEGRETDEDMSAGTLLIGPFIDAFPDPQRGLHVGGSLGLAAFGARGDSQLLEDRLDVVDYNGGGLGASAWVGYMGFVGPEWSMGGLVQLTGFATGEKDGDVERRASGYTLSLSLSALYH